MSCSRRDAIRAGVVGSLVGSAGCLTRFRTVVNREGPSPITLSIKTPPSDADPWAARIAQVLATNLSGVGVRTEITPMALEELFRDVLVNHDFDLYVAQYPMKRDPDGLRALFHSRFNTEAGWQNPLGFSDISIDEQLEEQTWQRPDARRRTIRDLLHDLVEKQPISVVAFPDEIRGYRPTSFTDWGTYPMSSPLGYLALDSDDTSGERPPLHVTVTDGRITRNLNPLTVEYRSSGLFTGLIYDPLARWIGDAIVPWLADAVSWDGESLVISLRDACTWHDGEALTAEDVEFTYRFFADTSLGDSNQEVPAPRYRGRSSLVDRVSIVDETSLRLEFDDVAEEVARRALLLPMLPRHIWRSRTHEANLIGAIGVGSVTEAIVDENIPAIGSGPLAFDRANSDESLVLVRNEDHFLCKSEDTSLGQFGVPFDRLVARVVPSSQAAVELVVAGEADATATPCTADVVPMIGRADDVSLDVRESHSFYHVGYNHRRAPLLNPQFRRVVARLLDKEDIVTHVFGGYAQPSSTPLGGTEWVPEDLLWDGEDPVLPFLGTNGVVSEESARNAFVDAGYRYDDDTLVGASS